MLTHIVRHIYQMPRHTNFKRGTRMEDDDPHQPQAPWPPRSKIKVRWSVWAVLTQWPINRKRIIVVSAKLAGYPMSLLHCAPVLRSKVRVTSWLTQTRIMCHIFRTVRPKYFKVGVRMEDVDLHQRQAPWPPRLKVKVISSHRLYVSSLPSFLIRETKSCTCVIRGGRGHTVYAEPGGHTY